jgi:hypothetical protein
MLSEASGEKKFIDLTIIEELRARRGQLRLRGDDLEAKREEIIRECQR